MAVRQLKRYASWVQTVWKKNFELVHKFYNQRRMQLNEVKPNSAHKVIAKIKEKYADNCYVITQNVDNLFERAGCEDVLHVHGELTKMECTACGNIWDIGYKKFDTGKDRCPQCNSLRGVKPYIVFFGGTAPKYREMYRAFDAGFHKESLIVIVGTMGNVVIIDELMRNKLCKKILNNLEPSEYINESKFDKIYYENDIFACPHSTCQEMKKNSGILLTRCCRSKERKYWT